MGGAGVGRMACCLLPEVMELFIDKLSVLDYFTSMHLFVKTLSTIAQRPSAQRATVTSTHRKQQMWGAGFSAGPERNAEVPG